MRIAIIGAGNMGGAIARGLYRGGVVPKGGITVANPSAGKLEALKADCPDLRVTTDNQAAVEGADLIILAVKPWLISTVVGGLRLENHQMVASVAAGICFDQLEEYVGRKEMPLFRLIPNTAIGQMQSMTLVAARHTTPRQEQLMLELFDRMGLALLLPEEKLAAATAMTSCGIAYVLKYVQAAMQAGVELGIPPKEGMRMMAQTLKGAAALLLEGDTHPAAEIDKVCTPGGITIRGINELEHAGFASAVIRAIKASC